MSNNNIITVFNNNMINNHLNNGNNNNSSNNPSNENMHKKDINMKSGRPTSFAWQLFTLDEEPWKLKKSICLHCNQYILYHKKSEYVLSHLRKCIPFIQYCQRYIIHNSNYFIYFLV